MSLLDALLLDPVRIDYWLAVRGDSCSGSGTREDPYNCSFINTPTTLVSQISASGTTATAMAPGHGLKNGERVLVWGATGSVNARSYNGVFTVLNATPSSFQYVMTGSPTLNAAGTVQCRRNPFLFDQVMRSLPTTTPIAVHLGSGTFYTLGYHEGLSGGWQILNKMRIVGEGIDVTTVSVAAVTAWSQNAYAMGHDLESALGTSPNLRDYVEIRDLTLLLEGSTLFPPPTTIDPLSTIGGVLLM